MNKLSQFKKFLTELYQNSLGLHLTDVPMNSSTPIWIDDGDHAWLLDDDIGLAMRIVAFTDSHDDLNASIQDAIRKASQLQPRYGVGEGEEDNDGIWQVCICWLVEPNLCNNWRQAIAAIRKESGFSEEIGLDAVLIHEGEDFVAACARQGLPQLMLNARKTFRLQWKEMPSWLSANSKVAGMLKVFPNQFAGDIDTYKLALELVNDVLPETDSPPTFQEKEPSKASLDEIEITNFRNIKHCKLRFKDNKKPTQAHIIFGPNGTGKTSIFEALYLSAGNTSNTLVDYLEDKDIEARSRNYTTVLTPLSANSTDNPKIFLNGSEKSDYLATTKEQAKPSTFNMEGTFQAQEDTQSFLGERGEDLAQRILKNYSTLADEVTKHADARAAAAKNEKTEWLKKHGLNAAISIRETRAKRLIEGEIRKEPWHPSQTLMDWLEKTSGFFPEILIDSKRIALRWKNWREGQEICIDEMAHGISLGKSAIVRQPLVNWLGSRNTLLNDTRSLINQAVSFIEPLRSRMQGVEGELDAWGEWLIKQANQLSGSTNDEQQQLVLQLEQTRKRLAEIRQLFSIERKHSLHIEKLKADFLTDWATANPDICPTCGEDHHDKGGIETAVNLIKAEVDKRLANYELEGKTLNTTLANMEAKLASFGVCPISEQRQAELSKLLTPFLADLSLQTTLSDRVVRSTLNNTIQIAQRLPDVQEPLADPNETAMQLSERCLALDAEAERLWSLPEKWTKIVKVLDKECREIVEKHLPDTLQKLWWEIALTLTPARWNLAAIAEFQMNRRATPKLIIGIKGRKDAPARYFFNQAERHIMGLAWFFTRYLTHGRFHRAFMVLDDPAQEMDQTTFRSFSRFTQALLRLHAKKAVPAEFVLFLHQEERALDMARATLGRFKILSWQKDNTETSDIREIRLLTDGFKPVAAQHVLQSKTNVAS